MDEALATVGEIKKAHDILQTFRGNAGLDSFGANTAAFTAIAAAQAKSGRFAEAIATARRISDARGRASSLYAIATVQAAAGQFDQARSTTNDAIHAVHTIADMRDREIFFSELSDSQREAGLLTEALATGRLIESPDKRAIALGWLSVVQTERGQTKAAGQTLNEAITAAQAIKDVSKKADVLSIVAVAQAKSGLKDDSRRHFAEALAMAEQVGHPDFANSRGEHSALGSIAAEQLEKGLLDEAFASTREVKYPGERGSLFCAIAAAQSVSGLTDQARKTRDEAFTASQSMKDADQLLGEIAGDQAKDGLYTKAIATARNIKDPFEEATTLCRIATAQSEKGLAEPARQTWAAALAAACQINASKLKDTFAAPEFAIVAAQKLKRRVLDQIVDAQAKAGLTAEAQKVSAEAAALGSQMENGSEEKRSTKGRKRLSLPELAIAQSGDGHFTAALDTARQIRETYRKVSTFLQIAIAQSKAGQTGQARQTLHEAFTSARQVQDNSSLREIAESQLAARLHADALTTAQEMEEGEEKANMLTKLALARLEAGQTDYARKILADASAGACGIEPNRLCSREASFLAVAPYDKEKALVVIAYAQSKAGFFEDALATIHSKVDASEDTVRVLCAIGTAMAKARQTEQARKTFAAALATACEIESPESAFDYYSTEDAMVGKAWASYEVATAQAKAGLLADALITARAIQDPLVKAQALCELADVRTKEETKY